MPATIINIAAYKFVTLDNLEERRAAWRALCQRLELKGTILLSREGVNLFLAGTRLAIDEFLLTLRREPALADLAVKESVSDRQPFTRMLVRIKTEIIAFGVPKIDPRRKTSPRLPPQELKRWLDEGRLLTLLDTRNDYEVKIGTFENAVPAGIEDFRHFPDAVARLSEELKKRPVVTFCTGGIRCEKAAPFLEKSGFQEVYQLDGGILKYFEECGGAHYRGDCFVFDQRVALDPSLRPSDAMQCFACQAVLTAEEYQSPLYSPGKSCPYCHHTPEEEHAALLEKRHQAIRRAAHPLPGRGPYRNVRPIYVPRRHDGTTVIDFLESLQTVIPRQDWIELCRAERLLLQGRPATPEQIVRAGHRLDHVISDMTEPDVNPNLEILYEDDALVVLNKPAPIPMHPGGRFNRNTVDYLLNEVYHPLKLRPAHRLDANTAGIIVFTKTRQYASRVQPQFTRGEVGKIYWARIPGHPEHDTFESMQPISSAPGPHGARVIDPQGQAAHTRFRVLRRDADGTALLEAVPLTGRTNQIRIHLWDLGYPIVGDPMYQAGGRLGERQTLGVEDPPMCLQSHRIEFEHPITERRVSFQAPVPSWFENTSRS